MDSKKHISRFKEVFILKFTLFKLKFKPKLKRFFDSPKFLLRCWQTATWIAVLILVLSISQILDRYNEIGENAIADGKRIMITLPYGEITAREGSIKSAEDKEEETSETDETEDEVTDENVADGENETDKPAEKLTVAKDAPKEYTIEDVRPKIIIIITGVGLSRTTTEGVFSLPAEVNLSFSAYANAVDEWILQANDLGFEILMDLPLEPPNYPNSDAGPYSLLTESKPQYNIAQLNSVLELAGGDVYLGMVGSLEEKFTFEEKNILPVLNQLQKENLAFIYTNRPRNYFLPQVARDIDVNIFAYDILVDEVLSKESIEKALAQAEKTATERGFAILVGRPYPITVKELHKWLKTFHEKGLLLVPLSTILK